jgi:competence protein ComEC
MESKTMVWIKEKLPTSTMLFLLAANFVVWNSVFNVDAKPDLEVVFFDVGQGDATFIQSKDGTQILIDGGPTSLILSQLADYMPYYDRSLDIMVVSHMHADHITGLISVLDRYEVNRIIMSGALHTTPEAEKFMQLVEEKNVEKVIVDKPFKVKFADGAIFSFLHPQLSFEGLIPKHQHDAMVVGELSYKDIDFLFMGDAESDLEDSLVRQGYVNDIDVLKVSHQGSKNSSTNFFLNSAKPEYAIIPVGKNKYGHPGQATLDRLANVGANLFRTDRDGAVEFWVKNGELIKR